MYTPPCDTSTLLHAFSSTPGDILEIGCNHGVTTRFLAEAFPTRRIFGVDSARAPMCVEQQPEALQQPPGHLASPFPNVTILEGLSPLILNTHRALLFNVRNVFIDGAHDLASVLKDTYFLLGFLPATKITLAWHDYYPEAPHWCKVNQVVNELRTTYPNIKTKPGTHLAWLTL